MSASLSRRQFVARCAGYAAVAAGQRAAHSATAAKQPPPHAPDHTLTVISGTPRERGRLYGQKFRDPIRSFLEKEIVQRFVKPPLSRDDLLRYAAGCSKAIRAYSPIIADEMEGMAEAAGLSLEDLVLLTLHEELWHKGVLPAPEHCTAIAAGPPDTRDGHTYVGENWDWMQSVYGLSSVLLWKRAEGPSVLSYSYPGLWMSAGLNSAGVALCWVSGLGLGIAGPRVGIPSYVLIAHLLYQDSLEAALAEVRRAQHAGWFGFVLADGTGQLVSVEATPRQLVVERGRGHFARVYYCTREMTGTPAGQPVKVHPQCRRMLDLLAGAKGNLDRPTLQGFFGDHQSTICKHYSTLDSMLFDCTQRVAHVSRGPGCSSRWKTFGFDEPQS